MARSGGLKQAAASSAARPAAASATPGTVLQPEQALAIPFAATLVLLALSALPSVRGNLHLFWSFWGAGAAMLAWTALTFATARSRGRKLVVEVVLRKQHYIQACAHLSILLYWGWYWRVVYDSAPLIAAQLAFAYAFDSLLAWSRRDTYTLGFGPFPIIFSTNLFLWFKPDWFYLQFLMVSVGFLAKELIRWTKDGRRTHIFNPSSFTLMLFSLILIATGKTGISWGPEIAATQLNPPHIYLWIFACALAGQYLFGVASMTWAAVGTTWGFCQLYFLITGTRYFPELPIPIAVFLGMHLLFTDPSTAPRTELGRLIFGVAYGLSVVGIVEILTLAHLPNFYDKLLPVPILNLTIRAIDRAARSDVLKRFDPGALGRNLLPGRRNLGYMTLWGATFATMMLVTGTLSTLVRADSLFDQGRVDEAIVRYREYTASDPNDPEGHNNLGVALMQKGQFDDARASFERSVQLKADSPKAQNNLGVALMRSGHVQEAIAPLQRAVQLQPTILGGYDNLGQALLQAGRVDEAIPALEHAAELQPNSPEVHTNFGIALSEAGRLDQAVSSLRRAAELQPTNPAAYDNLGVALTREGRFDEAETALKRSVELQPNNPEAQHNLGLALGRGGHTPEAIQAFQRAIQLKPDYAEARYDLAQALSATGQMKAAAAELRESLKIQPDSPPALASLAWLEATEPDAPRNPENAVRLATRAVDLSGNRDPHIMDALAMAYASAGRVADAIRTAETAAAMAASSDPALAAEIREHLALYRRMSGGR